MSGKEAEKRRHQWRYEGKGGREGAMEVKKAWEGGRERKGDVEREKEEEFRRGKREEGKEGDEEGEAPDEG